MVLYIGNHTSSSKGYAAMGRQIVKNGGNTFAFFTRNPRGGKAKEIDPADVEKFLELAREHHFGKIVAHAPYTMNACAAKENLRDFAREIMADDLKRMEYTPGNYYNFHPGSHVGQGIEAGIAKIAEILNDVLTEEQSTTVLLETMSGKGSEVGSTFQELKEIIDRENLDVDIQKKLVYELKRTRGIKPNESNWLLFASMVEAALLEFTGEYDSQRLYYGVNRFIDEWYKGDAWYGDGAELHLDYYNSLVIHPMLTDVLYVMKKHGLERAEFLERQLVRQQRMAAQLERMISPEATYPVVGRSIVYRFGAFHALSQIALLDKIPQSLSKGQIRSALTAVMQRQISMPGTFDENGWLKIGFSGSQINMSEPYINTGSLYMCTAVFLPLGLPANHPFWTEPYSEWTNLKAWKGVDVGADKALRKG